MATKRKPTSIFGPRVTNARPARGASEALYHLTYARELAERVRAVKERRAVTWKEFDERVGMTEKARKNKTIGDNPTPFTAEELCRISTELKVRPEYLLMGTGPMVEEATVVTVGARTPNSLTDALYEHLVATLRTRFGSEREGVTSRVPERAELLVAIEHGVGDAWDDNFDRGVEDRLRVSQAVRLAVHDKVRDAWEPVGATPETFQKLTKELAKSPPRLTPSVAAAATAAVREDTETEQGMRDRPAQPSAISEASVQARESYLRKRRKEPRRNSP